MKKTVLIILICLLAGKTFCQFENDSLSHFLFPEFTKGTVILKSGIILETRLNYSTVLGEMQFLENGKIQAIGDLSIIETIIISGRRFVPYDDKIYELLLNTPVSLYVQHVGKLQPPAKESAYGGRSETTAIESRSSLIMGGVSYDLSLPEDYRISSKQLFWLKKDNVFFKANNAKQIIKVFPDKKNLIKSLIKEKQLDLRNARDVIQIIYFCNK